jgi:hypothetical protein
MWLEYTRMDGLLGDECWADREKHKRFKRVAAVVVLPTEDEPVGCIVILGEKYQSAKSPPEFAVLKARVGSWQQIEQGLGDFRQRYQFAILVTEPGEEENPLIDDVPGLRWGSDRIPLLIVAAPDHSLTEVGRQRVDALIEQRRLHGVEGAIKRELDQTSSQAARALQCLVTYLLEHPAFYGAPRTPRNLPPSAMAV